MSTSPCVPGPVIVPFTHPDPPRSEAIQTAINKLLDGFERHRTSIDCTNDRIDSIIFSGASVLARRNSGASLGPRARFNFIEGVNVAIALADDAPGNEFDVTFSVPGIVTAGANVGGAIGNVFRDKTGTTLNFRTINPLSPLLGLTLGDQVLLAVITTPAAPPEVVGSSRIISGSSPIRINGGASSNLQSNIDISYKFNQRVKSEFWEEFIGSFVFAGGNGTINAQNGWTTGAFAGGGATALVQLVVGAQGGHPGIAQMQIAGPGEGIAAGDFTYMVCGNLEADIFAEGGWDQEWCARVTYSTEFGLNGNVIVTRFGFGVPNASGGDFTFGFYFEYDPSTTANWQRCTKNGGSSTKSDTGIPVDDNFHTFGISINGGYTSATFTIDGSSVGSNVANFPVSANVCFAANMDQQSNSNAAQQLAFECDDVWAENTQLISR